MSLNLKRLLFAQNRQWVEWLETAVITVLSIWVWMSVDHSLGDPLGQVEQTFFWPLFGPLLISIRYGFTNGVICGLLVIASTASLMKINNNLESFSFSIGVGIVLTAMIVGEFRDYWHEINQKHDLDHDYMKQKLSSFTQNYHLLKASHDQLEQRIAGQKISLRASVKHLQEVVLERSDNRFDSLCQPYIALISEIGGIEVGGIYKVNNEQVDSEAKATVGDAHKLDLLDPMLKSMMDNNKLLTPAKLDELEVHKSRYQVCIPLLDTSGVLQAIFVAENAKFFMLTPANIALMSLVSNFSADLLNQELQVPVLRIEQFTLFCQYLKRASYNRLHHGIETCLVAFVELPQQYQSVLQEIINFRRGADIYWYCETTDSQPALVVLLPLTSIWGAQQYITRIQQLFRESVKIHGADNSNSNAEFDVFGPIVINKEQDVVQNLIQGLGINV